MSDAVWKRAAGSVAVAFWRKRWKDSYFWNSGTSWTAGSFVAYRRSSWKPLKSRLSTARVRPTVYRSEATLTWSGEASGAW